MPKSDECVDLVVFEGNKATSVEFNRAGTHLGLSFDYWEGFEL